MENDRAEAVAGIGIGMAGVLRAAQLELQAREQSLDKLSHDIDRSTAALHLLLDETVVQLQVTLRASQEDLIRVSNRLLDDPASSVDLVVEALGCVHALEHRLSEARQRLLVLNSGVSR